MYKVRSTGAIRASEVATHTALNDFNEHELELYKQEEEE